MALTQAAFRFRYDDGTETTATWKDAENTDIFLANGSTFRLRIGFTSNGFFDTVTGQWQYSKNGGAWTNITTSSSVVRRVASGTVAHDTSTTNQLALAGSFVAGKVVTNGMTIMDSFINSGDKMENEWCLQLQSGDLTDTDTVEFRASSGSYAETPMLTVGSGGPSELTYCAGGDVELEWDTDSWDGPESWVLTESGGDWSLTNGVSTWTATWDGTGSEVFEIASGDDENLTITVTAGACVCKEHYIGTGKKTGLLTTSVITALIPKNNYRATTAPGSTDDKCAGWAAGSEWLNLTTGKAYKCVDASAGAAVWPEITPQSLTGYVPTSRTVTGTKSITGGGDLSANRTLELVNDEASPTASKYYGTNGSGTKGYHSLPSAGTVTSVGGTGTVNGITLTGTVTTSGNLTLGGTLSGVDLATQITGTLQITNGGTGATTAAGARTNLGIGSIIAGSIRDICGCRLGLALETTSSSATLYYQPYLSNQIALWDGSNWQLATISSISIGSFTANTVYDIFVDYNSGSPQLIKTAWTSLAARATSLSLTDGVFTNASGHRYVGTVYADGSSTIYTPTTSAGGSKNKCYIWNFYNRIPCSLFVTDTANSWTITTHATWLQANSNTGNQLEIVSGATGSYTTGAGFRHAFSAQVSALMQVTNPNNVCIAIGDNSIAPSADCVIGTTQGTVMQTTGFLNTQHQGGYRYYPWIEYTHSANMIVYGDSGVAYIRSGLTGRWEW